MRSRVNKEPRAALPKARVMHGEGVIDTVSLTEERPTQPMSTDTTHTAVPRLAWADVVDDEEAGEAVRFESSKAEAVGADGRHNASGAGPSHDLEDADARGATQPSMNMDTDPETLVDRDTTSIDDDDGWITPHRAKPSAEKRREERANAKGRASGDGGCTGCGNGRTRRRDDGSVPTLAPRGRRRVKTSRSMGFLRVERERR